MGIEEKRRRARIASRKYKLTHREKIAAYAKKRWQKRNKEEYRKRRMAYYRAHKSRFQERNRQYYHRHRDKLLEQVNAHARRRRSALKAALYKKLGGKCKRCGITDVRVLCVDHVNGGGWQERKESTYTTLYTRMLADTTGKYQLLCHNCNWIKRYERQEVGWYRRKAKPEPTPNQIIPTAA